MTYPNEDSSEFVKEPATPPPKEGRGSQAPPLDSVFSQGLSPDATQPISQTLDNQAELEECEANEVKEGVWGYLYPLGSRYTTRTTVLKKRSACPLPGSVEKAAKGKGNANKGGDKFKKQEEAYEKTKVKGTASGGYLIGRHPECGKYMLS